MKRPLIVLMSGLLLFSSCIKSVVGEGPVITETRQLPAFDKVSLSGSETVEIVQGTTQKVTVTGYANLLPIFETRIRNGELVLKFENGYFNVRKNNIKIQIELPVISAVSCDGSGDIFLRNFTNSTDLIAHINGSGNITVLNSAFDRASFSVNGSGDIKAAGAQIKEADVKVSGSGSMELTCTQKLKARITGSGNIDYYGNPTNADVSVSGSGKVRKR